MVSPGTKLGPYEIQDLLGAGGMGEVYRARDPRIGRDVAIKIVPSTYSENPERLRRFEQEARAAGLLNHPNILAIFDVGIESGSPYLVSELLEGETLRKKLEGGPLPKRKAIEYAIQIVRGLAAAHDKRIVHRDLKPENIFITKDGHIKILDFGLAKLIRPEPDTEHQSKLPTADIQSQPGVVLGTVGYMSPEQVRGRAADHRSDIFTFGAILHEMLTGKKTFQGETIADTLSAILRRDPSEDLERTRNISAPLLRVIDRCLEKDPEERFQSARDLAFALEAVSGSSDTATTVLETQLPSPAISAIRRMPFWVIAACLFFASSLILAIGYLRIRSQPAPVARFEIFPRENMIFTDTIPQVSPDGCRIVFEASDSQGKRQIYVRELDSLGVRPLTGTEGASNSFWSPDSRSVGFFAQGKLKTIDLSGGTIQTLCDAYTGRGGTWGRDNIIVFAPGQQTGLFRIYASGGTPVPVTELKTSSLERTHRWPSFLPDGKHFIFLVFSSNEQNDGIYVGSLDSKEKKFLIPARSSAVFAWPSSLLFLRQSTLMVQQFDTRELRLIGEARPVEQKVVYSTEAAGVVSFSVSENGVLVYRSGIFTTHLILLDRDGKTIGSIGSPGEYEDPALSADGRRLAITRDDSGGNQNVYIYDFGRNTFSRFTFSPANCDDPIWSPDGTKIVYSGEGNIYLKPSSGAEKEQLLVNDEFDKVPVNWSMDGRSVLFSRPSPRTSLDIWILPQGGKPHELLQSEFNEEHAQISPGGQWIAYDSDESGTQEVYVQSFPNLASGKWQISTGGGSQPRWRKDGKGLFYLGPDGNLMALTVNGALNTFEAETPHPLFQTHVETLDARRHNYDVFPDGQRFLINMPVQNAPSPITVILNWPALLKK